MSSVNAYPENSSTVKVANLYKKLGIANNIALKPPIPKDQTTVPKKPPRRQTLFIPQLPIMPEVCKNFQRLNTLRPVATKRSSSFLRPEDFPEIKPSPVTRNLTPKCRFISNWIQKNIDKDSENGSCDENDSFA
ncbi:hypothetical protein SteCoe_12158 [Stentor coeruleus]|uniref:Uncharacterized protein n=1 Tax=Stentor coeruleus TaxID=5963 RepID=A0A1R2CBJ4_9CILI|nr:hypothetical protein SteCoe_12158 [Stentor coeruleus]